MRKIPTIFERDWEGDRSRVLDRPAEGCEWVFAGEGVATRKYDGMACLVQGGVLYKRQSLPLTDPEPDGFILVEEQRGQPEIKRIGWVPVGVGPEDRWHREAFAAEPQLPDGTYELLGPKVQGNPEGLDEHTLLAHADAETLIVPRTFEGMRELLSDMDVEGFVFHHPDGRMGKIKGRDFGIRRVKRSANAMTTGRSR